MSNSEAYDTVVANLVKPVASTSTKPYVLEALVILYETPEGYLSSKAYKEKTQLAADSSRQSSTRGTSGGEAPVHGIHDEQDVALKFDLDAVAGILRWCDMSRPSISHEEEGVPLDCLFDSSYQSLLYCSRFFVNCLHLQVIGRNRFLLSWPMFAWPHAALDESEWIAFFEAGTYHNIFQSRMLSLAGHLYGLTGSGRVRLELHKAGLVHLADTVHWWKACPSDRNNSVLMSDTSTRLGHAYLGGCPMCPMSFEIVIIVMDVKMDALLAVYKICCVKEFHSLLRSWN